MVISPIEDEIATPSCLPWIEAKADARADASKADAPDATSADFMPAPDMWAMGHRHMGGDSAPTRVGLSSGGVCSPPADGTASALVQHAEMEKLCKWNPPEGFRSLCKEAGAVDMLRGLANPTVCQYRTCAIVGSGGSVLGARQGKEIDSHDAVIRLNLAPDARGATAARTAPHRHLQTWIDDIGQRTTWRVMAMEGCTLDAASHSMIHSASTRSTC